MPEANGDANRGRGVGSLRRPHQMHSGFGGRSPAFAAVARDTAGDDVFPVLSAALGDRHHMIEGQFSGGESFAAVLARVLIARVDVRSREWNVVEASLDLDIAQQADDRRQLEAEGN